MRTKTLRWYEVLSPEYTYTEPVMDDGSGPTMPTRDYMLTQAYSAREAIKRAVCYWLKQPRRTRDENGDYCRDAGGNPFRGYKATRADEETVANHAGPQDEFTLPHPDAPPSPAAAVAAAGPGAEVCPRTPAGFINNCALNVGFPESECQMCNGNCPDREKFRLTDPYLLAASEASGRAGGEDQEGGGHE